MTVLDVAAFLSANAAVPLAVTVSLPMSPPTVSADVALTVPS